MKPELPLTIFITGTDGAGKSCLARWLTDQLNLKGIHTGLVWSRFNNYLSKPLLALTRLTGHNYYKTVDGVKFGFHDFEKLYILRHIFALCQAIDANIGAYRNITRVRKQYDIVVCERGPWDTISDVSADTSLTISPQSFLGRLYTAQAGPNSIVILIKRSKENILKSRPELIHDYKLGRKISIYQTLADECGWAVVDNNHSLVETKTSIAHLLGIQSG